MVTGFLQRFLSLAAWGGLSFFFSLFVGSGAIVMGAMILVFLYLVIVIMMGPQFIAAAWIIGSPTFFGFPNEILRPLPFVTVERLLLVLLTGMVFVQYAFSKKKTPWLKAEITIVVFLVYAFISLLLHTSSVLVVKDGWLLVQYLMPMVGFIISRRIKWSENGLRLLLASLTLTGAIVACMGILQSLFSLDIFTMNYQEVTSGHTARAYGAFSNSHTYIATLFIFFTVSLMQYNFYRDAFVRGLLLVAMAIMLVGIILGETRAPWLGALLAFGIVFVKDPKSRPLMLLGGLFAFVLGLVVFVLMIEHMGEFIDRVTTVSTMLGRFATWATAINMLSDHPLFGVGFGYVSYLSHKAEYITGVGSISAQYAVYLGVPHNEYLHVAVMLGVTGLVLFLMILLGIVRQMFAIHHNVSNDTLTKSLGLYAGAIFIGLMFNSLFSDTYIQDYFWFLAYFLAGIAAGRNETAPVPGNNAVTTPEYG